MLCNIDSISLQVAFCTLVNTNTTLRFLPLISEGISSISVILYQEEITPTHLNPLLLFCLALEEFTEIYSLVDSLVSYRTARESTE